MVLHLPEMELYWQLKWFVRPLQMTGMTVEDYYARFRDWKEEMASLPFPAEEEDYIDGFIENLSWDIRSGLSKYSSRSKLINAFYDAKFEESMMFIEENLKEIKANRVAEGIRSELTVEEKLVQQPIEVTISTIDSPPSTTSFEVTVNGQVNEDLKSAITIENPVVEVLHDDEWLGLEGNDGSVYVKYVVRNEACTVYFEMSCDEGSQLNVQPNGVQQVETLVYDTPITENEFEEQLVFEGSQSTSSQYEQLHLQSSDDELESAITAPNSASKGSNDGVRYGKNAENGAYNDFMSSSVDIPCVLGYVAGAIESGSTKASPNMEFEEATMLTQVVFYQNMLDSEAYEVLDEMTKPFWTGTKAARNMFDEMPGQIPNEFQDAEAHGSKAEESQVNLKSNEQSLKTLEPWSDSLDELSEEEKLKDMEIISPMASQVIETFTLYDPFTYLHVQNNRRSCPTGFELHLADLCSRKSISLANGNRKDDIMLLFDPGGRSCSLRVWSWRYLYFFDRGGQFERKAIASSETHKVYEIHSKTAKAHVNGVGQRFCLQCSRFHSLSEFDDDKRSCQKHLAVHTERRRKNHASLLYSRRLIPSHSSANFLETSFAAATTSFVGSNVLHPLRKRGSNNWNGNASDYSDVSRRNNMYLCLLRTWIQEDRFAPNWGRPFDNGRNIKLLSILFLSRCNYQVYFDKILDGLRIWSLKSYFIFYSGGLLEDNSWKIITTNVAASLVESVTWELGRRSPIVVFEYDDIDKVVEWTVFNHFSIGRLVTWCQDIKVLGLLDEGCYSLWAHLGGLYLWNLLLSLLHDMDTISDMEDYGFSILHIGLDTLRPGKFELDFLLSELKHLKQYLSSNDYDGVTVAKLQNFVWDPGQNVISFYIFEDKDVFERVGKDVVRMDTTLEITGLIMILGCLSGQPFWNPDWDALYASCCISGGLGDTIGALDDIGLTPNALVFSTAELEHYIWDPGSFVSVSQLSWEDLDGDFHLTTLRTRWLLRGRICHDIAFYYNFYMYFRIYVFGGL